MRIKNEVVFRIKFFFQKIFKIILIILLFFWFIIDINPYFINYLFIRKNLIFDYLISIVCIMCGLIVIFFVLNRTIAIKLSVAFSTLMIAFILICNQFLF